MSSRSRHLQRRCLPLLLSLALAGCGLSGPTPTGTAATSAGVTAQASMDDFMADVFTHADADHNGLLTAKETGLLPEQIAELDKSHDGTLSRAEWEGKASLAQILGKLPRFLPLVLTLHTQ